MLINIQIQGIVKLPIKTQLTEKNKHWDILLDWLNPSNTFLKLDVSSIFIQ